MGLLQSRCYRPISIHALREEGDITRGLLMGTHTIFLSTPSARRATTPPKLNRYRFSDFYPRPPRGGRPRFSPIL